MANSPSFADISPRFPPQDPPPVLADGPGGRPPRLAAKPYPQMTVKNPSMRTEGEPTISTERVTLSVRLRFNPLRGLTPDRLSQYLDQFDLGFFRMAAITWDKIERRDTTLKSVAPKRKKAVARHGYNIVSNDGIDDDQRQMAEDQVEALKYFYDNLTATNAIKPDEMGGVRLLASQMMDAQSKYYAVHEIVWQPGLNGLTAQFVMCPLWWFEAVTAKLRYLDNEFQVYGRDMLPSEWLVTCGEGLMEACSVAWMFKHLPLQDWLALCEKFGMPFIDAATSASPGSPEWDNLVQYVNNFGPDGGGVRSNSAQINPIEIKTTGADMYARMVENMDRAMTILWRGGDLGTTGAKNATGASLQGDESDILEGDDAVLIEETLALQVSRYVINYTFGPDVPVLAYLKFKQEQDPDAVQFQRDVYKQFIADGTVCDVLANLTDLKKLTQDAGLTVQEDYVEPWLPVADKNGAKITGGTVEDPEGDIVGGDTEDPPEPAAEPKPESGPGGRPPASAKAAAGKPEIANDNPSSKLEEKGVEDVAAAVADDLSHVMPRLQAIFEIKDDAVFVRKLQNFYEEFPGLVADVMKDPSAARAIYPVMAAAMATGLDQKGAKRRAEIANGDLPGHEFHGNQYTDSRSEALALSKSARTERTPESHDKAAEAHDLAGRLATSEHDRQFHQEMAHSHRESAEMGRNFNSRMAEHQRSMAEMQTKLEQIKDTDPNEVLKSKIGALKSKIKKVNASTTAMQRRMVDDEKS